MFSARMYYDWEKYPERPLHFAFFFEPILPHLRTCYWLCDTWPLQWPLSDAAKEATQMVVDGITLPDTVLPRFADQLFGDRFDFCGFLDPPNSVNDFEAGLSAACLRDEAEFRKFVPRWDIPRKILEQKSREYEHHVRRHGSHANRYLDSAGVEFAFITNDTVWWFATRNQSLIDDQQAYAKTIPGMTCRTTASLGL